MTRRGTRSRDWGAWLDRVDWVLVVRGASTGFSVLVIGFLANPIFFHINQVAGLVELVAVALAASVVAAWRTRAADSPTISGAVAALISFTLIVPLIYLSQRSLNVSWVLTFAAGALIVGAVTGFVLSRGRGRPAK